MTDILLKLLNMSLTGSAVILAVLVLRLLLCRAPKRVTCLLWAVVFFRLLCPFSLESPLSVLPTAQPVQATAAQNAPAVQTGAPAASTAADALPSGQHSAAPVSADTPAASAPQPEHKEISLTQAAFVVWLAGFGALAALSLLSWLRLRRMVAQSIPLGGGAYTCPEVSSPFLLGMARPRIYLPEGLEGAELAYVLAHEQAHLARRDYLWKPLAWLAVMLHWFNPLVWLSFRLLTRDMELACDERATAAYGLEQRREYSLTLLKLAAPWHFSAACPMAFGEGSVKQRVKRVLNSQKPAFWLVAAAVAVVVLAAVCLGTNPQSPEKTDGQSSLGQEPDKLDPIPCQLASMAQELQDSCSSPYWEQMDQLLTAVTLEQLDAAVPFDWYGRSRITLLAEHKELGLTLYGYGDEEHIGEGLLLRYQEQIYPIHVFWNDIFFGRPELCTGDFDHDGQTEVAFTMPLVSRPPGFRIVYGLYVVEFLPDGTLEVCPFDNYSLVTEDIASTWDPDSHILRLYDGGELFYEDVVVIRPVIGDELGDTSPFQGTIGGDGGEDVQFEFQGNTFMSGDIFPIQNIVGGENVRFEIQGNTIMLKVLFQAENAPVTFFSYNSFQARIHWDGTQFTRGNYYLPASES